MTTIVKTHRAIQRALKDGKKVSYNFAIGREAWISGDITSAFYYQPDRCIIFTCDGQNFKAFPSQLHRFTLQQD